MGLSCTAPKCPQCRAECDNDTHKSFQKCPMVPRTVVPFAPSIITKQSLPAFIFIQESLELPRNPQITVLTPDSPVSGKAGKGCGDKSPPRLGRAPGVPSAPQDGSPPLQGRHGPSLGQVFNTEPQSHSMPQVSHPKRAQALLFQGHLARAAWPQPVQVPLLCPCDSTPVAPRTPLTPGSCTNTDPPLQKLLPNSQKNHRALGPLPNPGALWGPCQAPARFGSSALDAANSKETLPRIQRPEMGSSTDTQQSWLIQGLLPASSRCTTSGAPSAEAPPSICSSCKT